MHFIISVEVSNPRHLRKYGIALER